MWNSFCQQPQLKDVHSLRLPDQRISAKPPAPTAARMWHAELAPVGFLWVKSTHFLIVMSGLYWRFLFLCRLASDLST